MSDEEMVVNTVPGEQDDGDGNQDSDGDGQHRTEIMLMSDDDESKMTAFPTSKTVV